MCVCLCVYTHDLSLMQGTTILHPRKFYINHNSSAGAFEVPDSGSERLWVTAGCFLQYFSILSWLPYCDDVEPTVSAGGRNEIHMTPFSLAYAFHYLS